MTEKTIAESSRRGNEVREDEIDLLMLASHFLEHAKFIIVSLFIGAFLFGVVSMFLIHPKYESTAKLYIISASKGSIVDLTDLNVGTTLTADYEELIISEPVAEQVIKNLKLKETPEKLLKKISISNPQDTRVLYITATTESPSESMKLANEFINYILTDDASYDNSSTVGSASSNKNVLDEMSAAGGEYDGNPAYLPRVGYAKDEVFKHNEILKKKLADLWIKVKNS